MNICSDDHEEICFDDRVHRTCPICEQVQSILEETGDLIDELKAEIASMEREEEQNTTN